MIDKPADVTALRQLLGGSGEIIPLPLLEGLWDEYSGAMSAQWMRVDREALGNFAGWLAHILLWERGKRERGT